MLQIEDYLNEYSPIAADRFADELEKRVESLKTHPFIYQAYEKDPFFRRMVFDDYLLFYSVDEIRQLVVIHHIFHHSKDINRYMPPR